jgi:hypothetical protein
MADVRKCVVTYQAAKAAKIPKAPPARIRAMLGVVAPALYVGFKYPTPKHRKAKSSVKKRKKNATVDFSVRIRSKKVKMNQPCEECHQRIAPQAQASKSSYHQVNSESSQKLGPLELLDLETTGSQDDSSTDPETTVR